MHRDDLIELVFAHFAHGRVTGDPGVVDHDVQTAEVFDGGADEGVDIGGLRDVALHRHSDVAAAQLLGRDLGRLEIDVAEHNPRAFGDESFRDGQTQALRSACDHRTLTAQQRHLDHASLSCPPGVPIVQISYFI